MRVQILAGGTSLALAIAIPSLPRPTAILNITGSLFTFAMLDIITRKVASGVNQSIYPIDKQVVQTEIGPTKLDSAQKYYPKICGKPDGVFYIVPEWVEICYNNKPVERLNVPLDLSELEAQGVKVSQP